MSRWRPSRGGRGPAAEKEVEEGPSVLGKGGVLGGRWVHGLWRGGPRVGWPRGQQQHLERQLRAADERKVKIATTLGNCPYLLCTTDQTYPMKRKL